MLFSATSIDFLTIVYLEVITGFFFSLTIHQKFEFLLITPLKISLCDNTNGRFVKCYHKEVFSIDNFFGILLKS